MSDSIKNLTVGQLWERLRIARMARVETQFDMEEAEEELEDCRQADADAFALWDLYRKELRARGEQV